MQKAYVLLDRDGTLIEHIHHLVDQDLVRLKIGVVQGLKKLQENGFSFGIITNQSVIGRGMASRKKIEAINDVIVQLLTQNDIGIDFVFICPHMPDFGCNCRKPNTELGLRAILEYNMLPSESFMIGDQESDQIFGKRLGCKTIQVKGNAQKSQFTDHYSESFIDAVEWILSKKAK